MGYCQGNQVDKALCNCDLRSQRNQADKGVITAQWLLPIQEFGYRFLGHSLITFGRFKNGTANVTIGDLICQGKLNVFQSIIDLLNATYFSDDGMRLNIEGSLAMLDKPIEKTFWGNWGHVHVRFNFQMISISEGKKCLKIMEMSDPNLDPLHFRQTLYRIDFCNNSLVFKPSASPYDSKFFVTVKEIEIGKEIFVKAEGHSIAVDGRHYMLDRPDLSKRKIIRAKVIKTTIYPIKNVIKVSNLFISNTK